MDITNYFITKQNPLALCYIFILLYTSLDISAQVINLLNYSPKITFICFRAQQVSKLDASFIWPYHMLQSEEVLKIYQLRLRMIDAIWVNFKTFKNIL